MHLFSRLKNQYECPVCGRRLTDENRYCSACYMADRDSNKGSKVIRVVVKRANYNTGRTVLWIGALLLGLLLIGTIYYKLNATPETPTIKTNNYQKIDIYNNIYEQKPDLIKNDINSEKINTNIPSDQLNKEEKTVTRDKTQESNSNETIAPVRETDTINNQDNQPQEQGKIRINGITVQINI